MKSWSRPDLPDVTGTPVPLRLLDTRTRSLRQVTGRDEVFRLYVCGITPYDATHLGHAATYVTFDLVLRAARAAGHDVRFAENVTDVDDPLLERARRDHVDWRELAADQVQLFRDDMSALRVIPPDSYVGVEESMARHVARVNELLDSGAAYELPVPDDEAAVRGTHDVYLDLAQQPSFGRVSGWSRDEMAAVFADRGGDPERPGKRDVFDPLLWRGARGDDPSWEGVPSGPGRPGWHIECTTIAVDALGADFDVQGGGDDLIFPHHEMSAVQADALPGVDGFARAYVHQAMVAYEGEKISKSLGNLVRVSDLRRQGVDPMAVRLVLLAQHYRTAWEYFDTMVSEATEQLARWRAVTSGAPAGPLVQTIRERLADDLDTAGALRAMDEWTASPGDSAEAVAEVHDALDALLGIRL